MRPPWKDWQAPPRCDWRQIAYMGVSATVLGFWAWIVVNLITKQ
jgi:hypothetical protein